MIDVALYTLADRPLWNEFVARSKNGTFLLGRDYLEYHADRFEDFSLLFFDDRKVLRAVMPASRHGTEVRSHGGLTYGGLIVDLKMVAPLVLECFDALKRFLAARGVTSFLYKRIPYIYYRYPADEDLYALFINKARLVRRDISSCIFQADRPRFGKGRRYHIRKAIQAGLEVRESRDYRDYFDLLTEVLGERHQAVPVHTAPEMEHLARLHPDNIRLFVACRGPEMLAGALIYETPLVAHTQYLASSAEGRSVGALDWVMDHLVNGRYRDKRYFDFGISTENDGWYLNEGLIGQKQEFGGRGVAHDFYELDL